MMYEDNNRGKIQYRARKRQLIDFSGVRYGNVTPTDIDGFFELHDNLFVFYEYKYGNVDIPYGQKIAIQRLVKAIAESGREAIAMICRHNVENTDEDIDGANTMVDSYCYNGDWFYNTNRTVKELTDSFKKHAEEILRS